jgi:hypothetical protein
MKLLFRQSKRARHFHSLRIDFDEFVHHARRVLVQRRATRASRAASRELRDFQQHLTVNDGHTGRHRIAVQIEVHHKHKISVRAVVGGCGKHAELQLAECPTSRRNTSAN